MSLSSYIVIPFLCFFCSMFLFLVILGAKKSPLIYAFLLLLGCFVLWTGGSLLMRLELYPGVRFWYNVSAAGIFFVPFCIYNFLYYYTERRGSFARRLWLLIWLVISGMNLGGLFITDPGVRVANGVSSFHYSVTWLALIPIVCAAAILLCAARMIYRNVHQDGVPRSTFFPLFFGVIVMFVGILLQSVFGFQWLNTDTIFCGVNAVCIYYALYKKRLVTLTAIASSLPTYLMAISLATLFGVLAYPYASAFYARHFAAYEQARTAVFCFLFSIITILFFGVLRLLTGLLFVKGQELRERDLAQLGRAVSASLDLNRTLDIFCAFLPSCPTLELAYICLATPDGQRYTVAACTQSVKARTFSLSADNPLPQWLHAHGTSLSYGDFCRSKGYRAMWQTEKQALAELGISLVLPIAGERSLMGMVLLRAKNGREFPPAEVSYLESAASLVAIAFQNASLYAAMQREAQQDPLTELYNHRYFQRKAEVLFADCAKDKLTLLLFSLDDFRLFNELYGSEEGDRMLRRFGAMVQSIVGDRGIAARYGGKEFSVLLPHLDALTAKAIAREVRELLERELSQGGTATPSRRLTFSAGICSYPASASSLEELLSFSNMAVYSAKQNGKNTTVVYARTHGHTSPDGGSTPETHTHPLGASCASTIYALTAAIDAKDKYTFRHSNNVSCYAAALAQAIGLDEEHVEIIRQAGLLHDIGKIGIPEHILTKTTRLTDEEYAIMQQHIEGSIEMIRHLPSLDYVIPSAIAHHERWDGKGYPRGLSGEEIPIGGRCLCLADTFDAMTSDRPYRPALSVEAALQEIERNLGLQFDPSLGRTFLDLVRSGVIQPEPCTEA